MARRKEESLVDLLIMAPWWASIVVGIIATFLVGGVIPAIFSTNPMLQPFTVAALKFSPLVFLFFVFLSVLAAIRGRQVRSLVDRQTGQKSLQDLSWKEFEWMVAEAYRRQGYIVDESLRGGPDGGVDLVLRKDGRKVLVQCKRWRKYSVGAPVVRELYGLLVDHEADEAVVVTSGKFTREAGRFAEGKPITLIDGPALVRLVAGVKDGIPIEITSPDDNGPIPDCPKCGEMMVLRTAKRGHNAGAKFWGCSGFPKCRGTIKAD